MARLWAGAQEPGGWQLIESRTGSLVPPQPRVLEAGIGIGILSGRRGEKEPRRKPET